MVSTASTCLASARVRPANPCLPRVWGATQVQLACIAHPRQTLTSRNGRDASRIAFGLFTDRDCTNSGCTSTQATLQQLLEAAAKRLG